MTKLIQFTLIVLVNCLLFTALFVWGLYSPRLEPSMLLQGAVIAYICLAILLMAFGQMRAPWRQLLCTTFVVVLTFALSWRQLHNPRNTVMSGLAIVSVTWTYYSLLVIPKRLRGWKLNGDYQEEHPDSAPGNFSLKTVLGFMLLLSLPLCLFRLMISIDESMAYSDFVMGIIVIAIGLMTTLPLTLAAFANYGAQGKIIASVAWCIGITSLIAVLQYFGIRVLRSVAWLHLAIWCIALLNLFAARAMGVRWRPCRTSPPASLGPNLRN